MKHLLLAEYFNGKEGLRSTFSGSLRPFANLKRRSVEGVGITSMILLIHPTNDGNSLPTFMLTNPHSSLIRLKNLFSTLCDVLSGS